MLIITLLAAAAAYAAGVARLWRHAGVGQGVRRAQAAAFACGWLAIVGALVSPIDRLAEQSLAAHMLQHELLMVVAGPLVALAAPMVAFLWLLPQPARRGVMRGVTQPAVAGAWRGLTAPP